ncbi:MAG TPA: EAL domain-containing protein [Euzebya sp.]|nr:EAL domain-containing protein [Euzebya sp.]
MLRWFVLPAMVVLLGVGATVLTAHRMAVADRGGVLERQLAELAGDTDARVERFGTLVAGAAAHFSRSPHDPATITDEDLQDYMQAVGAPWRFDDLSSGISYVGRIYRDDLDDHVARRRSSMPSFTVGEGPNRVYNAIVWAESVANGEHGMRMDADFDRSTALADALWRNQMVLTAPVMVPGSSRPVVYVFGPVTEVGTDEPLGWISTLIEVDELVAASGARQVDLAITDHGVPVHGRPPAADSLQRSITIDVLGRSWRVTTSTRMPLVDASILITGLSLTALVTGATLRGQRARRKLASDVHDVRRSRDRYASFLEGMIANIDLGIIACEESGQITVANAAAVRMQSGLRTALAPGAALDDLDLVDADGGRHAVGRLPLHRALHGEDVRDEEFVLQVAGQRRIHLMNAQQIRDAQGVMVGAVAIIHDITDRKTAESQMTQLAMHDHLTGLANRRQLGQELDAALAVQRAGGPVVTLLFMDLDHFKQVNDTCGHHRGDEMLIDIGMRLAALAHPDDIAARMGGDEFVLLCPHQADAVASRQLAASVALALEPALAVREDDGVRSGVSIGVVRPEDGATVEDVLRQADLAMYAAKRERASAVRVYEPSLGMEAAERFSLEAALRRAVAERALTVAYQPIIDPREVGVVGVEALVRWERDGKTHAPAAFLPVAEETGLITDIDMLVLDKACEALSRSGSAVRVGVNLSARTLAMPDLVSRVSRIIADHGLTPDRLVLELTEHALIGGSAVIDRSLADLADLGVLLTLDDFGTGYASLDYLRRFPVRSIKIDRSFVTDLASSTEDRAIVASTIEMAARLGLRTVAEGVETAAQAAVLIELGCDMLQGYLFGRPTTFARASRTDVPVDSADPLAVLTSLGAAGAVNSPPRPPASREQRPVNSVP